MVEKENMNDIVRFRNERSLVFLRRDDFDENAVQGFILGTTDNLILLQYVYDFNLDGLMLLRTEDVTEIGRSKTEQFQQSLLETEGVLSDVRFEYPIDLTNWQTAISDLRSSYPLMILECELMEEPEFAIGEVLKIEGDVVAIRTFTGEANWSPDAILLPCKDLTSCKVNTNYANFYQRYFERSTP